MPLAVLLLTVAGIAAPLFADTSAPPVDESAPGDKAPTIALRSVLGTPEPIGIGAFTGPVGALTAGPAAAVGSSEQEATTDGDPSPRKAFFLSALVPGAGEYYAGARRKATVFFGLEALAWTLYFTWDGKGNDIEEEFRRTADEQFSPSDYLAWRETNTSNKTPITHDLPCEEYVVNIYVRDPGNFGDCGASEVQQYYELIGKYDQFVAGWSDLHDANGNPTQPVQVDSAKNFDSDIRQAYEDRRDDSNRYLKRAINMAGFALINHVISAVDAARTARGPIQGKARLERRTRLMLAMQPAPGGRVPMLMAFRRF